MNKRYIIYTVCVILSSCITQQEKKTSFDSKKLDLNEIKRVYGFKCAICHGKEGNSVIKLAPNLTESNKSFEESVAIIKYGSGTMPPHKDILDSETINGLAKYIDTFR